MFLILEWMGHPSTAIITQEEGDDEGNGNAIFKTRAEAEAFALLNCAFSYQVIEVEDR